MDDTEKKLITWKDADQALLDLAFDLLSKASYVLRHPWSDPMGSYPTGDLFVANGYVSNDPDQGWWSYEPEKVHAVGIGEFLPSPERTDEWPSAICWYSLQNLIRQRLRQARLEIANNRLLKKKKVVVSRQSSRNPVKRSGKSKYNRKPSS